MRFFTDNYFTEEQKAAMMGHSYSAYVQAQEMEKELEQVRQLRLSEKEIKNNQWQRDQQAFDRNIMRFGMAVLAVVILGVVFTGKFGMPWLSGI